MDTSSTQLDSILHQLEFYFSDSNIAKDRWMSQKIHESSDGYLPLNEFLNFNKLKQLGATLEHLRQAIRQSNRLQLSEDQNSVRRTTPANVDDSSTFDSRTIFLEHIPIDSTHDSLQAFCTTVGPVSYVSLPKYDDKRLKGFAFVEFESEDDAKRAPTILNKYNVATAPKELRVMTKMEWLELKKLYKKLLSEQHGNKHPKKKDNKKKNNNNNNNYNKKHTSEEKKVNNEQQSEVTNYQKGLIVRIGNIQSGVSKPTMKQLVESHVQVAYLDFAKDKPQAYIRCNSVEDAASLAEKVPSHIETLGSTVTCSVLTGEEERMYWEKIPKDTKNNNTKGSVQNRGKMAAEPQKKKSKHLVDKPSSAAHVKFSDED